jgi:PhnB protein
MIRGAADAIEFYKKAFGATELMRDSDAEGKVRHAEIGIGDSQVMITDALVKQALAAPAA